MRVAVFGLGYVGSVTAACLSSQGHSVVGVDVDETKAALLRDGLSPVVEEGLDEWIAEAVAAGRLTATTAAAEALAEADIALVCVGTPSAGNGSLSLRFLDNVLDEIGGWLATHDRFLVVAVRSTVLPGTVDERLIDRLERTSGKRVDVDFGVAFCPEFLRESTAIADFLAPPFNIAGVRDERSAAVMRELFSFLPLPLREVPIATAESLKYACNAFHAVKVTFANEMGRFLGNQGIDAREVMELFCDDRRLNISPAYLRPGFAFGGSCLPKDLRALLYRAKLTDTDLPMLASTLASNEVHIRTALRAVLDTGCRDVALLGLSFKDGTDDLRESPYVELAESLIGRGIRLSIYDTDVHPARLVGANASYMRERLPHLASILVDDPLSALRDTDVAVVATNSVDVVDAVVKVAPAHIIDLNGRLGTDVEVLPGYVGVAW